MKIARSYINKQRVMLGFIFASMLSCATIPKNHKPQSINYDNSMPVPVVQYHEQTKPILKDTNAVKTQKAKMTSKEFQDYLRQQYRINYDEMIGPDIKKLYGVIQSQAESLHTMTSYMQTTRHRTDSIIHERNYYRQISDSKDTAYQSKVISLQQQLLFQNKEANLANARQINFNTVATVSCLVGYVLIITFLIILWLRVNKLYKNFVKNA